MGAVINVSEGEISKIFNNKPFEEMQLYFNFRKQ